METEMDENQDFLDFRAAMSRHAGLRADAVPDPGPLPVWRLPSAGTVLGLIARAQCNARHDARVLATRLARDDWQVSGIAAEGDLTAITLRVGHMRLRLRAQAAPTPRLVSVSSL